MRSTSERVECEGRIPFHSLASQTAAKLSSRQLEINKVATVSICLKLSHSEGEPTALRSSSPRSISYLKLQQKPWRAKDLLGFAIETNVSTVFQPLTHFRQCRSLAVHQYAYSVNLRG
jgi:hypothetical protein